MKYVILIHSNPEPWGHPTSDYLAVHQALPVEERERLGGLFDDVLAQMQASGELVGGGALGDPHAARLLRWQDGARLETDGPYSQTGEHLAGYFVVDVASQARAEEVATAFSGPGETVELRPLM